MAYINVNDWKYEQVIEWLKGIECVNSFYIKSFFNNQVDGHQLLNISNTELTELGIHKIGHQEIILESIEHLKNFHFNLERENLQYLALQVATISFSLHKQLLYNPESKLETSILSEVARTIAKVKVLISWLDRYPFQGHTNYNEIRTQMLRLALELATVGQRDRFAQTPIKQITILSEKLSKLADYIIQDISDPMILQPAYLELMTLKKKESDLGFYIMPSYQFIHRITDVKNISPAHNAGKIEDGDEIVQINYQTVVGWQLKKVLVQLQESPTDVFLTLKKRPRHNNRIYGQLGLIKLPSKKRTLPYPSPRIEHLASSPRVEIIQEFSPQKPVVKKSEAVSDTEESSENESDILTPTEIKPLEKELRLYLPKPRAVLQRRHTICGDDLINYKSIGNIFLWHERKLNKDGLDGNLRDKSVSVSFGLNTRPSTSLGLLNNSSNHEYFKKSSSNFINKKAINTDTIHENDGENDEEQSLKTGVSKVVRFDKDMKYNPDSEYTCKIQETIIESYTPIPYADDDNTTIEQKQSKSQKSEVIPDNGQKSTTVNAKSGFNNNLVEAVNGIVINREMAKRGRLDKSLSTPTYDNNESAPQESILDIPPRRQQNIIPPVPPRKQPSAPQNIQKAEINSMENSKNNKKSFESASSVTSLNTSNLSYKSVKNEIDQETTPKKSTEVSELIMSSKIKSLTNKKKNSLIAKRRKISLKSLGSNSAATIQGHLYRRAKDKSEVAYWTKMYFVLMDIALYGFRNKEAQKADCAIFLNGFTVSLAKEVHSKEFAFKVYHPKKTFYFAAETSEAMTQWIEYIRLATLKGTSNLESDSKELYSETECSEDDFDVSIQNMSSPLSSYQASSEKSSNNEQTPPLQKTHYHLNFGSLKKTFGRYNTNETGSFPLDNKFLGLFSSSKSDKKASADIVPTAQFKTYRKVANNGGLQLGATSMINSNISDAYLPSSYGIDSNSLFNNVSNIEVKNTQNEEKIIEKSLPENGQNVNSSEKTSRSLRKAHNFLHASNPNLLDFNFHQTVDFPALNITTSCNWDHQNQQTGMTLLDLMLQQRAEEMKDMYDKRVDQGFERLEEKNNLKISEKPVLLKPNEDIVVDKKLLEIQKRCLPTPPDYAQSFKPNDQAILYTRSKEGLKLRDFGYELISNDDDDARKEQVQIETKSNDGKMSISKRKVAPLTGSIKKKSGFTWIISHDKDDIQSTSQSSSSLGTSGSFRRLRLGSNKQQNSDSIGDRDFSLNKSSKKSSSSFTTTQHDVQANSKILRKNSAPSASNSVIPYFTKLSFSSSNEKKLLGSPKLHRAIFGRNNTNLSTNSADHEIFTSITFPKQQHTECHEGGSSSTSSKGLSRTLNMKNYPDLSLPPVFKAETYSFSDK